MKKVGLSRIGAQWKVAKWLLEQQPTKWSNYEWEVWLDQLFSTYKAQKYLKTLFDLIQVERTLSLVVYWGKTDMVVLCNSRSSWSVSKKKLVYPFQLLKTMLIWSKHEKEENCPRPFSNLCLLLQKVRMLVQLVWGNCLSCHLPTFDTRQSIGIVWFIFYLGRS